MGAPGQLGGVGFNVPAGTQHSTPYSPGNLTLLYLPGKLAFLQQNRRCPDSTSWLEAVWESSAQHPQLSGKISDDASLGSQATLALPRCHEGLSPRPFKDFLLGVSGRKRASQHVLALFQVFGTQRELTHFVFVDWKDNHWQR